jgi:hypothetical protein
VPVRALLLLLLVTACSQGTTASAPAPAVTTPGAQPSPQASPSPSVPASPAPSVPATSATPAESPAPLGQPAGTAAAVTVTDADTVVSATGRREVFVLRTTGPPCQLAGYPTVVLLAGDLRLPVASTRGGQGLPPEQLSAYTLSRATSLSFEVATARTGSCQDATAALVTLPGNDQAKQVATDLHVCGRTVGVSPIHRLAADE